MVAKNRGDNMFFVCRVSNLVIWGHHVLWETNQDEPNRQRLDVTIVQTKGDGKLSHIPVHKQIKSTITRKTSTTVIHRTSGH